MNDLRFLDNQKKRLDQPLWMLICFSMFVFWQMGFIYFANGSLTLDNKTPLPIDADDSTALIAVSYVLSILWMIFIPKAVVWTQRIATGVALLTAFGFFLPLNEQLMVSLVYLQIFCCCFIIGFETFVMVNYFSEPSNIKHLTFAYGVALLMIAILQNEFVPMTFPAFRFVMVAALIMLLVFFLRMPAGADALPRYIRKSDGLTAPKKLLFGTYVLVFVGALMAVSGPAISGEIEHGVFITYLADAIASFIMYVLYKKASIHPFRLIPAFVGLGGIGFLLMFASTQIPVLAPIACGFIGFGLVPCQMLPLYGAVMMKSYPSKYVAPIIIGLSLAAVIVQSSMVEAFRDAPNMLYLVYAVVMVVLIFIYMQIEPFFLFALRGRNTEEARSKEESSTVSGDAEAKSEPSVFTEDPLSVLSPKEKEVAELICLGHTNADIAKLLFISEHTVKDHTKKIYPKMGVHSRLELATLVSNQRAVEKKQ